MNISVINEVKDTGLLQGGFFNSHGVVPWGDGCTGVAPWDDGCTGMVRDCTGVAPWGDGRTRSGVTLAWGDVCSGCLASPGV